MNKSLQSQCKLRTREWTRHALIAITGRVGLEFKLKPSRCSNNQKNFVIVYRRDGGEREAVQRKMSGFHRELCNLQLCLELALDLKEWYAKWMEYIPWISCHKFHRPVVNLLSCCMCLSHVYAICEATNFYDLKIFVDTETNIKNFVPNT